MAPLLRCLKTAAIVQPSWPNIVSSSKSLAVLSFQTHTCSHLDDECAQWASRITPGLILISPRKEGEKEKRRRGRGRGKYGHGCTKQVFWCFLEHLSEEDPECCSNLSDYYATFSG